MIGNPFCDFLYFHRLGANRFLYRTEKVIGVEDRGKLLKVGSTNLELEANEELDEEAIRLDNGLLTDPNMVIDMYECSEM